MFLKSLQMQGFKSFPEKTTLNFEEGITGVVGPNGSGKSNISDAVRWVLGEQSSKSLRGSKMEDVIFDGTKMRKPFGFAQVTLTLDNSDHTIETIDSDEVSVTRKYFRSGESEYRINGEPVRLKDVHQLFMDTGLGRDGYSMVSQGRVADLISDRNSGCREMLEEAAGISTYRYRRSDSIRKLERAEDNLVRLMDILGELESRVGPLKTQSEKAKRFLEYSDEKKSLEISLWLADIAKLKRDLKKHEDAFYISKGQYEDIEKQLLDLEESIERSLVSSQEATSRIEMLREEISIAEAEGAEHSSKIAVFENSIAHNLSVIDRIRGESENILKSRNEIEAEIKTEEKIISQLGAAISERRTSLEEINRRLETARDEGSSIDEEAEAKNRAISSANAEIAECRVRESTASTLIGELEGRLASYNARLEEEESNLSLSKKQNEENERNIKKCLESISEQNNVSAGLSMLFESHSEKADALKEEMDSDSIALSSLVSRIRMLEDLEKDMEGYSGGTKAVVKAAAEHKLKGIEGTISQLISVDEKHALAVETALGGAVQNIICRKEGDAKRAIEFLKSGNLGRVTFQPISSVRGRLLSEPEIFDCDGFVAIASELVECSDEYREIINSLLGRIAVAEDLDFAIQIAKRFSYKFKIVTLDGQVVNAGGSITGGSKAGGAGIISRSMEIKRLAVEKEKKSAVIEEKKAKAESLNKKLDEERKKLDEAKSALISLGEERIRLEGVKKLCLGQIRAAEQSIEAIRIEMSETVERAEQAKKDSAAQNAHIEELLKVIEEAEKDLVAISEKQAMLAESGEEISTSINTLTFEIHDREKELAAHSANANILKLRLIEDENRSEGYENEIAELFAENEKIRAGIAQSEKAIEACAEKKASLERRISVSQEERKQAERETTGLRELEKEKSSQREQLAGELARLEERKRTAVEEYETTIARLLEEYELTLSTAQNQYSVPNDIQLSRRRLNELKNKIRALGSVNVSAIEEYKEVSERYEFMTAQVNDIEKSKKELQRLISDLTKKMSEQFRESFELINKSFGETFSELFGGGSASLTLLDPTNILESEIEIKLQPPGKAIKRLDALSGGEKGLSAISLLFAILKVNPAPFCIFDEVEAALDDVNVLRYAQYVRKLSGDIQFILITHRRGSMEAADRLYGITMQEQGVSKLLELKTAELARELGIK